MQEKFEIGQIVNTFGIKGFVKVKPFTDDITRFEILENVYIKNKVYEIEEVKYQKQNVLVKFKGIDKIEEAELLKNFYIEIDRKDAAPLEEGSYYIADMLGLEVYTEEGTKLGILVDIYNTGSNDIYEVKDEHGKQILLPALKEVIREVNLEEGKLIVHLLEGLV